MTIVIFAALKFELAGILKVLENINVQKKDGTTVYKGFISGKSITIFQTGIGAEHALRSAELYIKDYAIGKEKILLTGFCGATRRYLKVGSIVSYKSVLDLTEYSKLSKHKPNKILINKLENNISRVQGATVSYVIGDSREKERLGTNYDIEVIDMESYIIGKVLIDNDLRFNCIRVVLDEMSKDVPVNLHQPYRNNIVQNIYRLFLFLIKSLKKLPSVIKFFQDAKMARNNLAKKLIEIALNS